MTRSPVSTPPAPSAAADDFHGAIDAGVGGHEPGVYDLHSVVGITQGTKQSVRLDGDKVVCEELYKGTDLGGDGTVPRLSATPAETDGWHPVYQPMYSADRHAALQNADPVQTQLYGILTAELIDVTRSFLGVRLEAPELLDLGESLTVRALPDGANLTLLASVTDLATGLDVGTPLTLNRDADDVHHGEVPPLPEGDYRLSVVGVGDSARLVDPVHGLFCVVPDLEPEPNEPPRALTVAGRLAALLVGIDAYLPPVNALYGCRNDITALRTYLEGRATTGGNQLDIMTLFDGEATRDAVVAAFRSHLGSTGPGDVALFAYAGHGSEEPAPPEVAHLEPTGRIQTLVLSDCGRRIDGKLRRGLADKELSVLIAEVADEGRPRRAGARLLPRRRRHARCRGQRPRLDSGPGHDRGRPAASS